MNAQPETERVRALRAAVLQHMRATATAPRRRLWTLVVPAAVAGALLGGGVAFAATGALDSAADSTPEAVEFPRAEVVIAASVRAPFIREISTLTGDEGTRVPIIDGLANGYASLTVEADTANITLYWHGPVPPSVEEIIDRHPEVSVRVVGAKYSLDEMAAARDALMDEFDAKLDGRGRIVWAGPDQEGRGVDFGVQSTDETLDVDTLRRIATEITDVTVDEIEVGAESVTLF